MREFFFGGFFYFFIGEKNFAQQNCIALFDFFSQKLCISIALIDTFLSIVAHLCLHPTSMPRWADFSRMMECTPETVPY